MPLINLKSAALLVGALLTADPARAEDPASLMKQHAGGTLHLMATGAGGTIDPQINYTSEF